MTESAGRAMAQAAQALLAAARTHKRAARDSRQAARKCMQDLDQLQRQAAALGIRLEFKA
jgi:hypothetical protein